MQDIVDKRYLLVFKTNNCMNCDSLIEKLDDLNLKINHFLVTHDNDCPYTKSFNIMVAPTTILIEDDVEQDRFYGNKSVEFIREFVEQ